MALPPIIHNLGLHQGIVQTRDLMEELQRQLATGKTADTYGDLGLERMPSLSMRREVAQIDAYQTTVNHVQIRLSVMHETLEQVRSLASSTRSDTVGGGFELQGNNQTLYQNITKARFSDVVALLNTEISGRYLFSGKTTDQKPVRTADEILNGDGGAAGFRQVAAERRLADLGADGRGRLVVANGGTNVSLSEDAVGSPFGFKLQAVNSGLTGTTVTGPVGAPASLDVAFSATLPTDGEEIALTVALPDGTTSDIRLTATNDPLNPAGTFLIGADATATAANFQTALEAALEDEGQTSLSAASLFAASSDFFDTNPPLRVNGPPFETATTQVAGTTADTVFLVSGRHGNQSCTRCGNCQGG